MLLIQHNLLAQNANRQLGINTNKNTKITEKLSSGYKINRAADDAAGLAISEKMRRQVRGLNQGASNIKDGIGYVQTAEGALNEVHDMLQRINELAVQAANGTNTQTDRAYIDSEIQALKAEMQRIFTTTSFNERKIWDYGPGEDLSGITYKYEPAVTYTGSTTSITGHLTNANCGVLAVGNYKVEADKNGIIVKWTGYDCDKQNNGKEYSTDLIKWDDVEVNGNTYSFKMEDHISNPNLLDKDGKSLINKTVSFTVNANALPDQFDRVIESINGSTMYSDIGVYMSVHADDCNNIPSTTNKVSISGVTLSYPAAYAAHASGATGSYTFDDANDSFLVPSSTSGNLTVPAAQSGKWVFKFNMPGIGAVTASSYSTSYHSSTWSDFNQNDKDDWWETYTWDGHTYKREKGYGISYDGAGGNLGSVESAITGAIDRLKKTAAKGGSSNGYVRLSFRLTADKAYAYGKGSTSDTVGYFDLNISLSTSDNLNSVLSRVNAALKNDTVLDFYNTATSPEAAYIGWLSKIKAADVKIPVYPSDYVPYDDTQRFFVQAGAEAGQHIDIEYECLRLNKIGMGDTNVLTEESAGNAIDEVKRALQKISEQRSDFGAYQNRLEHAYNINNNTAENTQSAESVIRDADIADMMMEYSINNILMQAGVSMLAQANQSNQTAVELLQ